MVERDGRLKKTTNLDSFSLSILSKISQKGYVILQIGRPIVHVLSNMQNVGISRCCFVTFCKQRQRNE